MPTIGRLIVRVRAVSAVLAMGLVGLLAWAAPAVAATRIPDPGGSYSGTVTGDQVVGNGFAWWAVLAIALGSAAVIAAVGMLLALTVRHHRRTAAAM